MTTENTSVPLTHKGADGNSAAFDEWRKQLHPNDRLPRGPFFKRKMNEALNRVKLEARIKAGTAACRARFEIWKSLQLCEATEPG